MPSRARRWEKSGPCDGVKPAVAAMALATWPRICVGVACSAWVWAKWRISVAACPAFPTADLTWTSVPIAVTRADPIEKLAAGPECLVQPISELTSDSP
ncbi:MAG: hypothetical protein UY33_C0003G0032 [Candidatus Amesbacteria bacterium GW2011_GWA1_48_9]|uniref:Uncharacterized protein n=1 Tax=Candidatus Amesbacteria bacterium GW2011_GWA1_48_9 TaxID=1618355 RepID=A0A0G1Y2Z9_9BACT|nr:MAG: hypothetical protein UY33_C0003G0032 [Candidatus Amesbacteria bacterium GW2011_GWA1_48_9]